MNGSYLASSCFPYFTEKLCLHEDCRMLAASVTVQVSVQDSVCHYWHIRLPQHVMPQQAMYLLAYLLTKRRKITFPTEFSRFWYRFMLEHKFS